MSDNIFFRNIIKDNFENYPDVLFMVAFDAPIDDLCVGAIVEINNEAVKLGPGEDAFWINLPAGAAGQFYLTAEITISDFYQIMLGLKKFATFNPKKVLKTYYRGN